MAYWDTSCLLKLYTTELDSADFAALVLAGAALVTSEIARLELHAALQRKEASGDLRPSGARKSLAAYDADVAAGLIAVKPLDRATTEKFDAIVEQCHHLSTPVNLRTLDAIHLSTAMVAQESQMVATDKRLREAAKNFGFTLFPPP